MNQVGQVDEDGWMGLVGSGYVDWVRMDCSGELFRFS